MSCHFLQDDGIYYIDASYTDIYGNPYAERFHLTFIDNNQLYILQEELHVN